MTTEEGAPGEVLQAGAIAVRNPEDSPEVLVVRARKNPDHWIFPKGHVEAGETPEAAAVRELREEAGVEGRLLGYVGTLNFDSDGEEVRAHYYLVQGLKEGPSGEAGREPRWCSRAEAENLLTFDDARRLLADAWSVLDEGFER